MTPAKRIVEEFIRRQESGDETVLDDLVAVNFVNHAAGAQGREGLRGKPAARRFIHVWRVADGMIVEDWACRDDLALVEQLRTA